MKLSVLTTSIGALLALSLTTARLAAQLVDYTLTDLGAAEEVVGFNNAGEVTFAKRNSSNYPVEGLRVYRLTAGGTIEVANLTLPARPLASTVESNALGQVMGRISTGGISYNWTFFYDGTQIIDFGANSGFEGRALNASGQITGTVTSGGITQASLYTGGSMVNIGTLGGSSTVSYAINDAGQVTGFSRDSNNRNHAFLYSGGVLQDLGALNGAGGSSLGYGINAAGWVTGQSSTGTPFQFKVFVHDGTTMHDLGNLGGTATGYEINASGQILGVASGGTLNNQHVIVSSGGVIYDLNDLVGPQLGALFQGSSFNRNSRLNDSGQIVTRTRINGVDRTVLLTPTAVSASANLWTGGSGTWSQSANWSLGSPTSTSEVRLAQPTATTVTVAAPASAQTLRVYARNHLQVNDVLTVGGSATGANNVTLGYFVNNGQITVAPGATLAFDFARSGVTDGRLDNQGTVWVRGNSKVSFRAAQVEYLGGIEETTLTGGTWRFTTETHHFGDGTSATYVPEISPIQVKTNRATITVEGGLNSTVISSIVMNQGSFTLRNGSLTVDRLYDNDAEYRNEGTLTLQGGHFTAGTYEQADTGRLEMEIGGAQTSLLQIAQTTYSGVYYGQASFGGTLAVSLASGFTPVLGDVFTLATYGGFSHNYGQHTFSQYEGLRVSSDLILAPSYGSGDPDSNALKLTASRLATWAGPSGSWETANGWSTGATPPAVAASVLIAGTAGTTVTTQGLAQPLTFLQVDSGNTLAVASGELAASVLINEGELLINPGATLRPGHYSGDGALSNLGTVIVSGGTTAIFRGPIAQVSNNTLTGGTWQVGEPAGPFGPSYFGPDTLYLGGEDFYQNANQYIHTNQATIRLFGYARFPQLDFLQNNEGTLQIGDGASFFLGWLTNSGTMIINQGAYELNPKVEGGEYVQTASGTLHTEFAHTGGNAGGYGSGLISLFGNATLDGTLKLTLGQGFTPQLGDVLEVLSYGSHTGEFANYTGLRISSNLVLLPSYNAQGLVLTATAVNPGTSAPLQPVTPGGSVAVTQGGTYAGVTSDSPLATGNGTTATVLDGTASGNSNVSISFIPAGNFAAASGGPLVSDIVDLHGTGSDIFVLQIDYNEAALLAGQNESDLFLTWFDGAAWVNAVLGDSDGGAQQQKILGAYDPLTDFLLGNYGVDTVNNRVWAVIDHNSQFGAGGPIPAPEPGSAVLLMAGGALLALRRSRSAAF